MQNNKSVNVSKLKAIHVPPTSNDPLNLFSCCDDVEKKNNLDLEPDTLFCTFTLICFFNVAAK